MSSLLRLVAVLTLILLPTACGSPKAGDKCSATGFLCESPTAALECRTGAWASIACRGAGGCQRDGDTIKCDMSANLEGDLCASSAEGKGLCTTDGLALLECRDGKLQKTKACSSCQATGDQVVCQP
jgi:hypothetical protein